MLELFLSVLCVVPIVYDLLFRSWLTESVAFDPLTKVLPGVIVTRTCRICMSLVCHACRPSWTILVNDCGRRSTSRILELFFRRVIPIVTIVKDWHIRFRLAKAVASYIFTEVFTIVVGSRTQIASTWLNSLIDVRSASFAPDQGSSGAFMCRLSCGLCVILARSQSSLRYSLP